MGRYRELIRMLIKWNNLFSRSNSELIHDGRAGVKLSAQQWQTLESIVEFEDTSYNMIYLAKQLGLPKSTFSKHVKALAALGLVERYRRAENRKDIVLKPSEKGLALYKINSEIILNAGWKGAFDSLEALPDDSLAMMEKFMGMLAADLEPENNKVMKLLRIP